MPMRAVVALQEGKIVPVKMAMARMIDIIIIGKWMYKLYSLFLTNLE